MRAVLINPHDMTITEIDTPAQLQDMYSLMQCDDINSVALPGTDTLWVDGEGVFKKDQKYFRIPFHTQPMAGYGLILGTTLEGDNADAGVSLETVKSHVVWLDCEFVNMSTMSEADVETQFGKAFVVTNTTYFRDIPTDKVYSGYDKDANYTPRELPPTSSGETIN